MILVRLAWALILASSLLAGPQSLGGQTPTAGASPNRLKLAFFAKRDANGQIIRLEPGGRYYHVAISFGGGWIHAAPHVGVQFVKSLGEIQGMGVAEIILKPRGVAEPEAREVSKYLSKPYDDRFSWTDDAIYCSELVAKLLGIKPLPMVFEGPQWPDEFKNRKGDLGLSPDDIFLIMTGQEPITDGKGCQGPMGF